MASVVHSPRLTIRSNSGMRRAVASKIPKIASATVSFKTSGVCVAIMLRFDNCSLSSLLLPTENMLIIFQLGEHYIHVFSACYHMLIIDIDTVLLHYHISLDEL